MAPGRLAAPTASTAATSSAAPAPADAQTYAPAEPTPEFPGCRPVRITREAIADYESRIEYWDAATETAWVACEPNTVYHESPGQVPSGLLTRIADLPARSALHAAQPAGDAAATARRRRRQLGRGRARSHHQPALRADVRGRVGQPGVRNPSRHPRNPRIHGKR